VVAPPVIFPRRCFLELSRLRGDRGARSVILRNIEDVSLFKVKSRFYLTDIDTVDDLHEAEGLFEHREARE
jgi:CTP:molybdopterin cytidylyltransferase MocA